MAYRTSKVWRARASMAVPRIDVSDGAWSAGAIGFRVDGAAGHFDNVVASLND